MSDPTNCPKCNSENIYQDGNLWNCPECSHEWNPLLTEAKEESTSDENVVKDANGTVLSEGDSVTVIKDLKIKGSSSVVKVGTKVEKHSLNRCW